MLTSSRFLYQDLRGLRRSLFSDLPVSMSQVHLTSWAVNGLPSCHLTPSRSGKVSSVPSSLHDQLTARSGTIDCMLFCGTSCLYITRLLKTPIIGRLAAAVASSCNDMLAGLSKCDILRMPPCFCANAASPGDIASSSEPAAASRRRSCFMWFTSLGSKSTLHLSPLTRPAEPDDRLFVQPDVLHAKIVDDAVDHHRPTLHLWLPAVCEAVVEDDRPRSVLSQPSFDLPHQLLALAFVGLRRLPLEQLFELGIAIP